MEAAAVSSLRSVLQRIQHATDKSTRKSDQVRLVAVSKTKPVSLIHELYKAGHRCFGENYVQEIAEKAPLLPDDIGWHFIGHLQTNKVKTLLAAVPNLAIVESVDNFKVLRKNMPTHSVNRSYSFGLYHNVNLSREEGKEEKVWCRWFVSTGTNRHSCELGSQSFLIANRLDTVVASIGRTPLKVFVQVNTSGEESKHGVDPSGCVDLAKHVKLDCPNLVFSGLMTIGMLDYTSTPENFKTLSRCRTKVCQALEIEEEQCELSMGMSADFELAIEMGSTNVRVGSTIFGAREYPKKENN